MSQGMSETIPYTFTLGSQVPSGVSTAAATIATAVSTQAVVPGVDGTYCSQKLGEFEAFLNKIYGAV